MKPVLLLVDIQGDFLGAAGLQPAREMLTGKAAALLRRCRDQKISVIHIWTSISRNNDRRLPHWKRSKRWWCVLGTQGHKTPEPLLPVKDEIIVHKTGFNGFAGGELDAALKKFGADTIIVAGLHLHTCVRTIAAEGLERGLRVWVADDAVATDDPVYAAATRRWLSARCVEFLFSCEIMARMKQGMPSKMVHRSPRDTKKVLFEIANAGARDISAATKSARMAWEKWRRTNLNNRCEILEAFAKRLEKAAPNLARQMAVEIGKPVKHGREEVVRAAANVRDVMRRARAFKFEQPEAAGTIRHEPVGVIALISPWNNPVAIPVGKIAPALIYGNTVVWKPAPTALKISEAVLKLLREAGAPKGAVQILTGDHTVAQELAAGGNIDAVTITGSAEAGFAIQEICARRFLPLQAELSGNNAAIVWDDADLRAAAAQVVWGAFGFAGQRCTANRRVIVSAAKFDEFWRELKIAAEKLGWGDPLKMSTDIGPVIHQGKCEEHMELVRLAQNSGAASRVEFLFAGQVKKPWARKGAYAQPVMLACEQADHPLVQEETMSPMLVAQRAKRFRAGHGIVQWRPSRAGGGVVQ